MSKAYTEKVEEKPGRDWQDVETAPSVLREDEPTTARWVGTIGAALCVFGGAVLAFNAWGWSTRVDAGYGVFFLVLGVIGMLYHAVFDGDLQVRRIYWVIGGLFLMFVGALLCVLPWRGQVGGGFGLGYPALGLSLMFLLAVLRHEFDPQVRQFTLGLIGGAGALMAVLAFLLGNNFGGSEFLVPYGTLLAFMGLFYLTAFVSRTGIHTDAGFKAALGIGALGVAAIVIAVARSLPALLYSWRWIKQSPAPYVVPWGLIFLGLGLLYLLTSLFLWSDNRTIIMTRRELSAFFFSPIAYLVMVGLALIAWFRFRSFLGMVYLPPEERTEELATAVLLEPIIQLYVFGLWPVICVIFVVPVLTMRLMSEERRSGTLEVTLTAPVSETSVVLSKFFAGLIMFMLLWLSWALFMVALRVMGGQEFDYRPLLSFFLALACTGAGFVAMGLFFSSLTRNQIISAVLTFAGMVFLTYLYFIKVGIEANMQRGIQTETAWHAVLSHISYVDTWFDSVRGSLIPRQLLFHLTLAVLWLFATIKVLEARKWS